MQKVSYMGDGSTTEFSFNFPYFENTNIVVTKNGLTTTGYSIVGTAASLNADIPYTGGKVVFETAPSELDNITIARSLPLSRVVDYQPTAKIEPTSLNQDMNYMMELLKDLQDELDSLSTQYSEIADKESTTALLAQISTIHDEIITVSAKITALGDISTLRQTVTTNGNNITTLTNLTTGLLDYVIASQAPTAQNNYTWYRKYKSGWVEQGGRNTGDYEVGTNTLPVTMANTSYSVMISRAYPTTADDNAAISLQARNLSTTTFQVRQVFIAPGGGGGTGHGAGYAYHWVVFGMSA